MTSAINTRQTQGRCATVSELLPWRANETLTIADRRLVDEHVRGCASCAALLRLELRVLECIRARRDNVEPCPQASLQRVLARLDGLEQPPQLATPVPPPSPPKVQRSRRRFLRVALMAQAAAIALLALILLGDRLATMQQPRFHTLATGDPTLTTHGALVRIAFEPGFSRAAAHEWARAYNGRIVAGPTSENLYTLALGSRQEVARQIASMRAHPAVLLAESIEIE